MATYNEKGELPSEGDANVGLDPVTNGKNRDFFWNDRFVEPKQQHRFTIKLPIYTPNGPKKDSLQMALAIKDKLKEFGPSTDKIQAIFNSLPAAPGPGRAVTTTSTDGKRTELLSKIVDVRNVTLDKTLSFPDKASIANHLYSKYEVKVGSNTGPGQDDFLTALGVLDMINNLFTEGTTSSLFNSKTFSTATRAETAGEVDNIGLYMRVSEYIGFSFTPPGFSYAPGDIGLDGQGRLIRIEGMGTYSRSAATLTFITTLRDDLHFSLNLLWALSTSASDGSRRSSVRLFDPHLTGELNKDQKVVTIYEHYARQTKDGNGNSINGINKYAISGIHKLYDPYIESVAFSEFSYGGAELVKVTVNLTYGAGYDQSNFYSYQITEDRYGKGTVYAMDEGAYRTGNQYYERIYDIKPQRSKGKTPAGKTPEIIANERTITRNIIEGDDIVKKNELVTKGISSILQQRDAERLAEAQAQADRLMAEESSRAAQQRKVRNQQINDEQSLGAGAAAATAIVPD
jgi:hypothetical protein